MVFPLCVNCAGYCDFDYQFAVCSLQAQCQFRGSCTPHFPPPPPPSPLSTTSTLCWLTFYVYFLPLLFLSLSLWSFFACTSCVLCFGLHANCSQKSCLLCAHQTFSVGKRLSIQIECNTFWLNCMRVGLSAKSLDFHRLKLAFRAPVECVGHRERVALVYVK